MRRIGRHRRKKQKKFLMIGSLSLLLLLCAGYAAFSTNLSITAKGNIKEKLYSVNDLKKSVISSGDGLYVDPVEENRYVYRGTNPNNYVTFNDEDAGWRIIAIESDGTLKLRKIKSIGEFAFDNNNRLSYSDTQYCYNDEGQWNGCSVWGSKTTMRDSNGNNVSSMPYIEGSQLYELPDEEASLNTYLNTTYYDSFSDEAKELIQNHSFNVGFISNSSTQTLDTDVYQEHLYTWIGNVGIINATDYVRASTDSNCVSAYSGSLSSSPCKNNNYIYDITDKSVAPPWFTINARDHGVVTNGLWYVSYDGNLFGSISTIKPTVEMTIQTFPVVYIKSSVKFSGSGMAGDPYVLRT